MPPELTILQLVQCIEFTDCILPQEFTDDSDLSYLERNRLETEYCRTKDLKRKTEQYAVEAKQTAQRLSAENFKLKEDLRCEQHFNELTRKSMIAVCETLLSTTCIRIIITM